jgi:hypothetical protein
MSWAGVLLLAAWTKPAHRQKNVRHKICRTLCMGVEDLTLLFAMNQPLQ